MQTESHEHSALSFRDGYPVPCLVQDDNTVVVTIPVRQLVDMVLDPVLAERMHATKHDTRYREYQGLREVVQRPVTGAKAKNVQSFAKYIAGAEKGKHYGWFPAIMAFSERPLRVVLGWEGQHIVIVPFGHSLVCVDGETQRIAWQRALDQDPAIADHMVTVIIRHGEPVASARQGFVTLNTKEIKPNASVVIAKNTLDPATNIARALAETSPVLKGRVDFKSRSLAKTNKHVMTISALRTAMLTTLLGSKGLTVGTRPLEDLPEGTDFALAQERALTVWTSILNLMEASLEPEARQETVAAYPTILAGIGMLAHRTMPTPLRSVPELWTPEAVVTLLRNVVWERKIEMPDGAYFPWQTVAGKISGKDPQNQVFSISGPKEAGYRVADALLNPDSEPGRRIRGQMAAKPARKTR